MPAMALHEAYVRHQQMRWLRCDAARWVRPDAARWLKPGTRPEDIYPALAFNSPMEIAAGLTRKRKPLPRGVTNRTPSSLRFDGEENSIAT